MQMFIAGRSVMLLRTSTEYFLALIKAFEQAPHRVCQESWTGAPMACPAR